MLSRRLPWTKIPREAARSQVSLGWGTSVPLSACMQTSQGLVSLSQANFRAQSSARDLVSTATARERRNLSPSLEARLSVCPVDSALWVTAAALSGEGLETRGQIPCCSAPRAARDGDVEQAGLQNPTAAFALGVRNCTKCSAGGNRASALALGYCKGYKGSS